MACILFGACSKKSIATERIRAKQEKIEQKITTKSNAKNALYIGREHQENKISAKILRDRVMHRRETDQ